MSDRNNNRTSDDPWVGSSLVRMLIVGLALIVVGMIVVMAIT